MAVPCLNWDSNGRSEAKRNESAALQRTEGETKDFNKMNGKENESTRD